MFNLGVPVRKTGKTETAIKRPKGSERTIIE